MVEITWPQSSNKLLVSCTINEARISNAEFLLKIFHHAQARWLSWLEDRPIYHKDTGSIPDKGI